MNPASRAIGASSPPADASAAPSQPTSPSPGSSTASARRRLRFGPLALAFALVAVMIIVALYFAIIGTYAQSTDDAYVDAHVTRVTAKVPAYVQALHIDDNSTVTGGELLLELDPRDYQAEVDIAEADLAAAEGRLAESRQAIGVADSATQQSRTEVEVAQANATLAAVNLHRLRSVSDSRAVSSQRVDEAVAAANGTTASLDDARLKVRTAQAQADLARDQRRTAEAAVEQARAKLAQAELNLSYTRIFAAENGSVANKSVERGDYVQPGQMLFALVPDRIYVIANFKETQLTNARPGQAAVIRVDTFPGLTLHGHVDSLQRGTGARFALLPPENATGNFVKVVQRVPVKIVLDDPPETIKWVSPGMSVEARIEVRRRPWWLGRG